MGAFWFGSVGRCLWLVALLALTTPVLAQGKPNRFKGTNVVSTVGKQLEIHFENPSMANKWVTIVVANLDGGEFPTSIKLDAKGVGSKKIATPNWDAVFLYHPSSALHGIVVLP
jgi:hypothetical protein